MLEYVCSIKSKTKQAPATFTEWFR